jgi:hypothetical protein
MASGPAAASPGMASRSPRTCCQHASRCPGARGAQEVHTPSLRWRPPGCTLTSQGLCLKATRAPGVAGRSGSSSSCLLALLARSPHDDVRTLTHGWEGVGREVQHWSAEGLPEWRWRRPTSRPVTVGIHRQHGANGGRQG